MEEFTHLGSATARGGFLYAPSSTAAPPPPLPTVAVPPASMYERAFYASAMPHPHNPNPNPNHSSQAAKGAEAAGSSHTRSAEVDMDAFKARIVAHPQYSTLVGAYMECQKVGAPPNVVERLSAAARELELQRHAAGGSRRDTTSDPELDQFMEAYCDMLVKYREELTRPLQDAMDFLKRVESQLNAITDGTSPRIVFPSASADDKFEGVGSSEEDQDGSGGEAEISEIDPRAEDKELKHHLLKKYSGYLSSLRHELSKKKKKGKLPKDARQKLLNWWELHYKWPYPSETEKVALAESTGLDQKQINNWFINQRKRHWKPSEDIQLVVMDGFHPHSAASLYMEGQFLGDGPYRLGP